MSSHVQFFFNEDVGVQAQDFFLAKQVLPATEPFSPAPYISFISIAVCLGRILNNLTDPLKSLF